LRRIKQVHGGFTLSAQRRDEEKSAAAAGTGLLRVGLFRVREAGREMVKQA
jgi:hypothetical protein